MRVRVAGRSRQLASVCLVLTALLPLPARASACPGVYCTNYVFIDPTGHQPNNPAVARWPSDRDGIVRIPFWVNPNHMPWMSDADFAGAAQAGAMTWMRANPRLRLIYMGVTDDQPVTDGGLTEAFHPAPQFVPDPDLKLKNIIAWWPSTTSGTEWGGHGRRWVIWISTSVLWQWAPCTTKCTPYRNRFIPSPGSQDGIRFEELQSVMTHEWGHVLGLGDLGEESCGLTMNNAPTEGTCETTPAHYASRSRSTLGLGDILGLLKLYPVKCPSLKKGQRMPVAYAQICPKIHVYVP